MYPWRWGDLPRNRLSNPCQGGAGRRPDRVPRRVPYGLSRPLMSQHRTQPEFVGNLL